uniref:Nitrate excretion transporter 1 n=1 Tax=Anthurium amnicola TaxID=1678845 RepID=A0A1D1Z8H7_9ARAE
MAAKVSERSQPDLEDAQTTRSSSKQGGWITFPFITGSLMGLSLAVSGVTSNLIVYLIEQFNVQSIDAAQISNIVNGCTSVAPVLGAVISDSFFGCFTVVAVSTFVSFLSMIMFTLTAALRSLRPTPCAVPGSNTCQAPTTGQLAVLYGAVALMCVATGGTRFNTATMGADQFDAAADQDTFFNWFFVAWYAASIVGATAVVYVQDGVSWGWGFGVCAAASAASIVVLLMGTRHYRRPKPAGSPFTGLARVVIAAARKWRVVAAPPEDPGCYYYGPGEPAGMPPRPPSRSFRCLNRAAVKTDGDIATITGDGGATVRPWRLCTVEEVEDLKAVVRILPLWSTSIFLSISIGIQASLTVLQALSVDRSLSPRFSLPAGSIIVSSLAATALCLPLLDRCLFPACRRLTGRPLTPLQRVGLGHAINAAAMAASALVEARRIRAVRAHRVPPGSVVPMSVLWLLPPLVVAGVGEALHFPGQVALYYREFPPGLRSSGTGMIALIMALGFYLSTAVVGVVRKVTDWLPDDVNASKLDRVYWMLAAGGVLNLAVFVAFARAYRYGRVAEEEGEEEDGDEEGKPGVVAAAATGWPLRVLSQAAVAGREEIRDPTRGQEAPNNSNKTNF